MRKLLFALVILFFAVSPSYGQTWQKTYNKAVNSHQKAFNNFDEFVVALKFANLALELAKKEFGIRSANFTKTDSLVKRIEKDKHSQLTRDYILGANGSSPEDIQKRVQKLAKAFAESFSSITKKENNTSNTAKEKKHEEMSENEILKRISAPIQQGAEEYKNWVEDMFGRKNPVYEKLERLSASYEAGDTPAVQRLEEELLKDAELALVENIKNDSSGVSDRPNMKRLLKSSDDPKENPFIREAQRQNKDAYFGLMKFYEKTKNRPKIVELLYWRLNLIERQAGKEHVYYEGTLRSLFSFYEKEENFFETPGFKKFEALALDLLSDKQPAKHRGISWRLAEFYLSRKEYHKFELTGHELVSEDMDDIVRDYFRQGDTKSALSWAKKSIQHITQELKEYNGKCAPSFQQRLQKLGVKVQVESLEGSTKAAGASPEEGEKVVSFFENMWSMPFRDFDAYEYYLGIVKAQARQAENDSDKVSLYYADFFETGLKSIVLRAQFYFTYDNTRYRQVPTVVKSYEKAEPLYREALKIIENSPRGVDHPDNLICADLADIYTEMSRYKEAEKYYQRCKNIREKLLSFENYIPTIALTKLKLRTPPLVIENDGHFTPDSVKAAYSMMGKTVWISPDIFGNNQWLSLFLSVHTKTKEKFVSDSVRVFINRLKANDDEYDGFLDLFHTYRLKELYSQYSQLAYARSLYRLGKYYVTAGEFQNAGPALDEALAFIKPFAKDDPTGNRLYLNIRVKRNELRSKLRDTQTAYIANDEMLELATTYFDSGKLIQAEVSFLLNLSITEKKLRNAGYGIKHSDYVNALLGLAGYYQNISNYEDANSYYERCLPIQKKIMGEDHPEYSQTLIRFGNCYVLQNRYVEAEELYIQANQSFKNQIEKYFTDLNETEKSEFYDSIKDHIEAFNSFVLHRSQESPRIVGELYNLRLVTKALLLNSRKKLQRSIRASGRKNLIDSLGVWTEKRSRLASLSFKKPEEVAQLGVNLKILKNEIDNIEKYLQRESKGFLDFKLASSIKAGSWQEIQKRLQPEEAAIEIVHFRKFDKKWTEEINYAALIITAHTMTAPVLVLIENGNDLENSHYNMYEKSRREPSDVPYTQYWQPIAEKLTGIETVYLSQDGIYHKMNLNTLLAPGGEDQYLMDEINIRLVSNTKDILQFSQSQKSTNKSAILIGNNSKGDLPGAEVEIGGINTILTGEKWATKVYKNEDALERMVKKIQNPTVLHIATHGEFNPAPDENQASILAYASPMLHSKLVFAETNVSPTIKQKPNEDDGFLTAYEASTLLLDQTELVVLSACETGVGDNRNGEGVYGLQRAFMIAGAKTMIMSLWRVNDKVTQEFMKEFYTQWVINGKEKRQAFKVTQLNIRDIHDEPYEWGGFVMIGE